MHTMQSNHLDKMSDAWSSVNFMDNMQPLLYFNPAEQATSDSLLSYESTVTYPVLLEDLYPPTSSNKLQLNDFFMQNSCDIPPLLTVVPPIYQALEDTSIFDICMAEQQEVELQKNLVKDVFFSPAMIDHNTRNPSLLSTSSFESNNDDCHSVISDSTATSSSSSSYRYAKEDDEDLELSSNSQDPVSFFYGLDLPQSTTTTTVTGENSDDTNKFDGLGTTATSSETIKSIRCNRRTKRAAKNNSNNECNPLLLTTKKKICRKEKSRLLLSRSKRQLNQTEKLLHNENSYHSASDAISCDSQKLNAASAWEYKKSDNKNEFDTSTANIETEVEVDSTRVSAICKPRSICSPTIYQKFSRQNIDWCRYCGTTEGVNWRPGPWGKRTLCNKHGCDYKGYGFACKLPRLDLTLFASETIDQRTRPVMQSFCSSCQGQESWEDNQLVLCDGCPKAFHQKCYHDNEILSDDFVNSNTPWYCNQDCQDNLKRKKVVVELPRKRLPLMRTPKNATFSNNDTVTSTVRLSRLSMREQSKLL